MSDSSEYCFDSDAISDSSSVKGEDVRRVTWPQGKSKPGLSGFRGMFGSSRDKDEQATKAEIDPVLSLVVDCNSQKMKEILKHVYCECRDYPLVAGEYFSKNFLGGIEQLKYSSTEHQINAEFDFVSSTDYSKRFYYKNKDIIFILCDLHQRDLLAEISKLVSAVKHGYFPHPMPVMILLVVDSDPELEKAITDKDLNQMVNRNNITEWHLIDTSHFPSLKTALTSCLINFQKTHQSRISAESTSEKKKFCSIM